MHRWCDGTTRWKFYAKTQRVQPYLGLLHHHTFDGSHLNNNNSSNHDSWFIGKVSSRASRPSVAVRDVQPKQVTEKRKKMRRLTSNPRNLQKVNLVRVSPYRKTLRMSN